MRNPSAVRPGSDLADVCPELFAPGMVGAQDGEARLHAGDAVTGEPKP